MAPRCESIINVIHIPRMQLPPKLLCVARSVAQLGLDTHVICTPNECNNENARCTGTTAHPSSCNMPCKEYGTDRTSEWKKEQTQREGTRTDSKQAQAHRNFPFKSIFELFIHCHTSGWIFCHLICEPCITAIQILKHSHTHTVSFSSCLRCVQLTASKSLHSGNKAKTIWCVMSHGIRTFLPSHTANSTYHVTEFQLMYFKSAWDVPFNNNKNSPKKRNFLSLLVTIFVINFFFFGLRTIFRLESNALGMGVFRRRTSMLLLAFEQYSFFENALPNCFFL